MPPKCYSYSRFSNPEQEKGDSLKRQTEAAKLHAARFKLPLDTELTLEDRGRSGWTGANVRKGALGQFLNAIDEGLVEVGSVLIVENLDRVSRQDPWVALPVFQQIIDAGVAIFTTQDGRLWSREEMRQNPYKIMESLMTMIRANDESNTKSRRVRSAWESKRAKAAERPLTAKCPAWLKLDKQAGRFEVIEERANVVQRIYAEALEGRGQHLIAETLNREGVPVFGSGKHWHSTYITKLLNNPAVIGTFTPHTQRHDPDTGRKIREPQEPVTGYFPPIIEQETFDRLQSLRSGAGTPRRGRHASKEVQNIFGGLAKCGRCGETVTRTNKGSGPKGGAYLVCTAAKSGKACKYQAVRYARVEDAFLRDAEAILATAPAGDDSALDRELLNIEGALFALKDRHENILDAIERGGWSADLDKRRREVEAKRDTLQEEERVLLAQKHEATGVVLSRRLDALGAALGTSPLDRTRANAIMRQTFWSITVDYESGRLVFVWRHGGESAGAVFGWPEDSEDAASGPV